MICISFRRLLEYESILKHAMANVFQQPEDEKMAHWIKVLECKNGGFGRLREDQIMEYKKSIYYSVTPKKGKSEVSRNSHNEYVLLHPGQLSRKSKKRLQNKSKTNKQQQQQQINTGYTFSGFNFPISLFGLLLLSDPWG